MLTAVLFILQKTSSALGAWLSVPVMLTDDVYIHIYDFVIFLFILPLFLKLMQLVMSASVNVSNGGRK